ncbi:Pre-mRNA-splicing factor cwf16 [Microbotryomycetes sp. JL201]|nr:Pre-mRNA-splicing factor cwf16 [Microbotryomycetes sp. JL201]
MSERKVLNKYYPPNFDPSLCSAEITFKTDPKNTDYQAEHGASRNFEPWRDMGDQEKEVDKLDLLEQQEEDDAMAKLESKAIDSKREMDILDALQEIKSRNSRLDKAGKKDVDADKILARVTAGYDVGGGERDLVRKLDEDDLRKKQEEAEDEEEVRRVFGRAFVEGVPDIELDEDATTEEDSEPGTPRDGDAVREQAPRASGSSSSSAGTAPGVKQAAVKRKLDAVEPTPASLLSEASKTIVAKSTSMAPPPKKKGKGSANAALAAKLGIKVKK